MALKSVKQVIDYIKNNKMDIQKTKISFWIASLVFEGYCNSDKVHSIKFSPNFLYLDSESYTQIIAEEKIMEIGRWLYRQYLKDNKIIDQKIKEQEAFYKKIKKIWQRFNKNISDKELLKIYRECIKAAKPWWYYSTFGENKGKFIEELIIPKFQKKYNLDFEKAQDLLCTVATPKAQAVFTQERKMMFEIALDVFKNKKLLWAVKMGRNDILLKDKFLQKKFKEYKAKFFWIESNYYQAREMSFNRFIQRIKKEIENFSKEELLKELQKLKKEKRTQAQKKRKFLSQYPLTKEDKKDIYLVSRFIDWMDLRKEEMMAQLYYLHTLVEEIGRRLKLPYDDVSFLTYWELDKVFKNKEKINWKEVEKRKKGIVMVHERGKMPWLIYGEDAHNILKLAEFPSIETETQIKGTVACTGGVEKIIGRVRVIFDPGKAKFGVGEILVTTMTRVEFVSLMKIAKAIITNEGGMACHAAIVSRELNIPCIVGTKTATKFLKTSDQIQLDLDKGTIKKI